MAPKRSAMEFTPKGGAEEDEIEEEGGEEHTGGPTHSVEHAKSGRATCKYCKGAIPQKELKVTTTPAGDATGAYSRHLVCWKAPKNFATSSLVGFGELTAEEQELVKKQIETGPKPLPSWTERINLTVEQRGRAAEIQAKYGAMKGDALKDVLKANGCVTSGKKDELVERCSEGELLGRLPWPCPLCKAGSLKRLDGKPGTFDFGCTGSWNSDSNSFHACGYKAFEAGVTREPWAQPGGPGDLTEVIVKHKEGRKAAAEAAAAASGSLDAAAAAEINALAEPRKAVPQLVELIQQRKLSIDAADVRQKAYTALVNTQPEAGGIDVAAALAELAQAYPAASDGGAFPSEYQVAVAANMPLALAFLAKSKLEKDGFKKKAAETALASIAACPFAISSGNQVAKGKQKLPGVAAGSATLIDFALANVGMDPMQMVRVYLSGSSAAMAAGGAQEPKPKKEKEAKEPKAKKPRKKEEDDEDDDDEPIVIE